MPKCSNGNCDNDPFDKISRGQDLLYTRYQDIALQIKVDQNQSLL